MYILSLDATKIAVYSDGYIRDRISSIKGLGKASSALEMSLCDLKRSGWDSVIFKRYGAESYDPLSHPLMKAVMDYFSISADEYRHKKNSVLLFNRDMIAGLELLVEHIKRTVKALDKGRKAGEVKVVRDFFVTLGKTTAQAERSRMVTLALAA
ncbi:hypothetical protein HYZ97_01735 [Candidatus Pacearchaeota archaeon]|nr:hypothetical protein [Candidatus Pacearchaeota archaeon]